jgi:hypothetical protein
MPIYTQDSVNYSYEVGSGVASVSIVFTETGAVTIVSSFVVDDVTYTVTSIGSNAFEGRTGLTGVTIPSTVTIIGSNAFSDCYGLTSITIPAAVTKIAAAGFLRCNGLTSMTIPAAVTEIGDSAFDCENLTSVTFLGTVLPTIGTGNFINASDTAYVNLGTDITSLTMFTTVTGNLPTVIYAPQDFYLVEDFSCNATGVTAAYFDAAATPDVSGNFPNKAEILVSKTVVQELFQYWTDSIDMTDVSANDILYRVYYNAADSSNAPLSSLFVSGAIVTATAPNTNPYNLNRRYLPQDYLRFLALRLFNTTKGVDLFANETQVLMSVDERCKVALNARLSALTGETPGAIARDRSDFKVTMDVTSPDGPSTIIAGTLDTTANPSKKILRQIMQNDAQRLDLTGAAFGADASGNWYKMPFVAGDKLYFPITITSPTDQDDLVGPRSVTIEERTYLIKCIVTDSALPSTPGPDGSTSNQFYSV